MAGASPDLLRSSTGNAVSMQRTQNPITLSSHITTSGNPLMKPMHYNTPVRKLFHYNTYQQYRQFKGEYLDIKVTA